MPTEEGLSDLDLDLSDDYSLSSRLRSLLKTLFHLFYLAAPDLDQDTHSQSIRLSQAIYFFTTSLKAAQLISLLYPIKPFEEDWDQFSLWTTIVSAVRVDFLLVKVGLGAFVYYAGVACVVLPIFLYLLLYNVLKAQKERKWRLRIFVFKLAMRIISGVLFMPLLSIFVASQKYLQE